jgi:hypothetical protein
MHRPSIESNGVVRSKSVRVNLADDLEAGDWDVVVGNDGAAVKLPVKLRIVKADGNQ